MIIRKGYLAIFINIVSNKLHWIWYRSLNSILAMDYKIDEEFTMNPKNLSNFQKNQSQSEHRKEVAQPLARLLFTCILSHLLTCFLFVSATFAELIPTITLKHNKVVKAVTFSPDGSLLATGSRDTTAKVWKMPSGELLATLDHDCSVGSISFSPDGKLLATGSKVWEMPSGKLIASLGTGCSGVSTFSPDGKLLATNSLKAAKVWEMPSGKLIATLKHGYSISVSFSPDGKLLATGPEVWEMPSGKLIATLKHGEDVTSVSFSSDGKLLATGSFDNTAKVWEMPSGKLIATLKHDGDVGDFDRNKTVSFSPDGKLLATGSFDNTAKVWEMPSGKLIATLKHGDDVSSVSFSPDGKLLATGSFDKKTKVWEMPSGKLIATLNASGFVWQVAFSPDGKRLATSSYSGVTSYIKVWMPNTADIPTLTQPTDGIKFVDVLPSELKWQNVPNFLLYQVQVAKDNSFAQLIVDTSTNIESLNMDTGQFALGTYFWRVRTAAFGAFGNWSEVWTFSIIPPQTPALSAPEDGKFYADTLPTLKWQASQGATSYGMQVAKDDKFTAIVIEQTKITKTEYTVLAGKLETNQTYYWRVNATGITGTGDWSEPWSFSLIPPKPPVLSTPIDKTNLVDTLTPTLKWQASANADSYSVQIAADEQFTPKVVERSNIRSTEYTVRSGELKGNQTYYWRVNATGVTGTGEWSTPWTFSLVPPEVPELSSPQSEAVLTRFLTQTLTWQTSVGAKSYGVQVATDDNFSQVLFEQSNLIVTQATIPAGNLNNRTTYYWRVNATGVTGPSDWSQPWSFSTNLPVVLTQISKQAGLDITVEIVVEEVKNLSGFQLNFSFNEDVLKVVEVTEGSFLKSDGSSTFWQPPDVENKAGKIRSVVGARVSTEGVDGSGALASIQFKAKKTGTSNLTLSDVQLSDVQGNAIPIVTEGGSVEVSATSTLKLVTKVDKTIILEVVVDNVSNLHSFIFDLTFDAALLEVLDVSEGDFLKSDGHQTTFTPPNVDASSGIIAGITSVRGKKEGVDGSGVLARIEFKIWDGGTTKFSIRNSSLLDPLGNIVLAKPEDTSVTVVGSPEWDVNKDYVVDTQDIVILGINFDKQITGKPRPNPDVKADGVVNIFDVVLVVTHYADEYSAVPQPPAAPVASHLNTPFLAFVKRDAHSFHVPTAAQRLILQHLYEKLKRYPDTDASVVAVKRFLATLLQQSGQALPKKTRLVQNYPNPFNPETWIPFELAEAADVTIRIYDAKGQLVRTLALGRQNAGFYLTPERAADWDGRNDSGERIASGVYFYTFTAGTFTATRKLTVLK